MLEIDHIRVSYGAAVALWDVSITIGAGELVCVVPDHGAMPGVGAPAALLRELEPLLAAELNVKAVRWAESGDSSPMKRPSGERAAERMTTGSWAMGDLLGSGIR